MKDDAMTSLESMLEQAPGSFPYPPTPDLAPAVMRRMQARVPRRLALAAVALLVVLAGLLAVPEVRAAVLEVLRIGAVRIFLGEPTAPARSPLVVTATPQTQTPAVVLPTATPWTVGLGAETTLAEAAAQAGFAVRLPAYPADAGPPDQVFVSSADGPVAILVWLEPTDASRLRFALFEIGPGAFFGKGEPQSFEETQVNDARALWITGAHEIYDLTRTGGASRLVEANVLIWEERGITYRLETWLDMNEALCIAESLP